MICYLQHVRRLSGCPSPDTGRAPGDKCGGLPPQSTTGHHRFPASTTPAPVPTTAGPYPARQSSYTSVGNNSLWGRIPDGVIDCLYEMVTRHTVKEAGGSRLSQFLQEYSQEYSGWQEMAIWCEFFNEFEFRTQRSSAFFLPIGVSVSLSTLHLARARS